MRTTCLLICHKLSDKAGTTIQAIKLSKSLAKKGFIVYLCGEGKITVDGVNIISLPSTSNPIKFILQVKKYTNHILSDLDFIQAFDPLFSGPAALNLKKNPQTRSIIRLGAVYEDFYISRLLNKIGITHKQAIYAVFKRLFQFYLIFILRIFDLVYANCNFLSQKYQYLSKRRVHTIYNILYEEEIIDLDSIKISQSEGLKILIVGRIEPRKNIDQIIVSLIKLSQYLKIEEVTIIGSTKKTRRYAQAVLQLAKNRLEPKIKELSVIGFIEPEKLVDYYRSADLSIFATNDKYFPITEGLPNVVIESIANGLPVIATGVAGVPEILTGELSAFLIHADDVVTEIVNRIKWYSSLGSDDKLDIKRRCATRARICVEDKVIEEYMECIQ